MSASISMEQNSPRYADSETKLHKLNDKWILWAHLPHDTDWTLKSYKKISNVSTVEEAIALCETIPEKMTKNCMLFLMRDGILPTWEDEKNIDGGSFSYKINNKYVPESWKTLFYNVVGESISNNIEFLKGVNGITISPKKNFCILKIWMSSCKYQNPDLIKINDLSKQSCLFKKHNSN